MYKFFTLEEFACPCGKCKGFPDDMTNLKVFVNFLDSIRSDSKVKFKILSGFRCNYYNSKVGGVENSAHTKGLAADIRAVNSFERYEILRAILRNKGSRIGIYETFIHFDIDYTKPYPAIWR